ncbi:hypothetical protein QQ045_012053 [Rhodiola kirilowii]
MREFNSVLEDCGLIDLGFSVNPFTYTNKRMFPYETKARLDRAFGNVQMRNLMPNIMVEHSFGLGLDHCPLIINFWKKRKKRKRKKKKLFAYESMWQRHPMFASKMEQYWQEAMSLSTNLNDSLKNCAQLLKGWNDSTFGNVGRRIKEVKEKPKVLNKQERTSTVVNQEKKLTAELEEWLAREEYMWRQRSRVEWLREGDQNTSFFMQKHLTGGKLMGSTS